MRMDARTQNNKEKKKMRQFRGKFTLIEFPARHNYL